jgi:hypothetical protein
MFFIPLTWYNFSSCDVQVCNLRKHRLYTSIEVYYMPCTPSLILWARVIETTQCCTPGSTIRCNIPEPACRHGTASSQQTTRWSPQSHLHFKTVITLFYYSQHNTSSSSLSVKSSGIDAACVRRQQRHNISTIKQKGLCLLLGTSTASTRRNCRICLLCAIIEALQIRGKPLQCQSNFMACIPLYSH